MLPERRTRSWTTEPYRISNHRDRVDLPMTICVTLLACAKPITSSRRRDRRWNGDRFAAECLGQPQRIRDPVALFSVHCRLRRSPHRAP
jgi:hypothetical protein